MIILGANVSMGTGTEFPPALANPNPFPYYIVPASMVLGLGGSVVLMYLFAMHSKYMAHRYNQKESARYVPEIPSFLNEKTSRISKINRQSRVIALSGENGLFVNRSSDLSDVFDKLMNSRQEGNLTLPGRSSSKNLNLNSSNSLESKTKVIPMPSKSLDRKPKIQKQFTAIDMDLAIPPKPTTDIKIPTRHMSLMGDRAEAPKIEAPAKASRSRDEITAKKKKAIPQPTLEYYARPREDSLPKDLQVVYTKGVLTLPRKAAPSSKASLRSKIRKSLHLGSTKTPELYDEDYDYEEWK
ncbi:hypothetical protein HDV06_001998 [Boothiomyces sp. JEL0866]|nr:hypothetical protein HDV06_001998 [Boothiomyces sp. JEL0866]